MVIGSQVIYRGKKATVWFDFNYDILRIEYNVNILFKSKATSLRKQKIFDLIEVLKCPW